MANTLKKALGDQVDVFKLYLIDQRDEQKEIYTYGQKPFGLMEVSEEKDKTEVINESPESMNKYSQMKNDKIMIHDENNPQMSFLEDISSIGHVYHCSSKS